MPVLRKAAVSRPVTDSARFLIEARAALTLEGLVFDRAGDHETADERAILLAEYVPVRVANCRFRTDWPHGYAVWANHSPDLEFRNTSFGGNCGTAVVAHLCSSGDRIAFENCIVEPGVERHAVEFPRQLSTVDHLVLELRNSTLATAPVALLPDDRIGRLEIRATQNLFVGQELLSLGGRSPPEAEAVIRRRFRWEGDHNLYRAGIPLFRFFDEEDGPRWQGPEDWARLWGGPEAGALVAEPRFEGADGPGEPPLTEGPAGWRLAPGSPGHAVGVDGRDLGADVDLVGPGPAFERWRATPAYARWSAAVAGAPGDRSGRAGD